MIQSEESIVYSLLFLHHQCKYQKQEKDKQCPSITKKIILPTDPSKDFQGLRSFHGPPPFYNCCCKHSAKLFKLFFPFSKILVVVDKRQEITSWREERWNHELNVLIFHVFHPGLQSYTFHLMCASESESRCCFSLEFYFKLSICVFIVFFHGMWEFPSYWLYLLICVVFFFSRKWTPEK